MNKLEMAHEYAKIMLDAMVNKKINLKNYNEVAHDAFLLADAMQAEADKRDKAEAEQKRKEMRELLNAENTFIEREGQHFDDVEWQPDWSQVPDEYKWAGVTADYTGNITGTIFFISEPDVASKSVYSYYIGGDEAILNNSTFGYVGRWQDSLRKRPN